MNLITARQFFLFLVLFCSQVSLAWISSCPNGYKRCASTDQPFTITTPTTLSNCVFDECPQLIVIGTSLTLIGVTFQNSVSASNTMTNGGCINVGGIGHQITIINSKFINCTTQDAGGAIYATASPNAIIVNNTDFIGCVSGTQGGGIGLIGQIDLLSNNCNYINCSSQTGGGINMGVGALITEGGSCIGCNADLLGGCFCMIQSSNFINRIFVKYVRAGSGGFVALNGHPTKLLISNSVITNSEQVLYFYSEGGLVDYLSVVNCTFDYMYKDVVISYYGLANFTDVRISNFSVGPFQLNGLLSSYYLSLTRVVIDTGYQTQNIYTTFSANVTDCVFQNIKCFFYPFESSFDTNIKGLVVRNLTVITQEVHIIGFWQRDVNPVINFWIQDSLYENIHLQNNNGLGIFHVRMSPEPLNYNINIGTNVTIRDSSLTGTGALFYIEPSLNITFASDAKGIQFYNVMGTRFTSQILAYFTSTDSYFLGNLKDPGNRIEGVVYHEQNSTSTVIKQSSMLQNVLPHGVYYTGPPSYLTIYNAPQMETNPTVLYRSQKIPTIQVTALDYYGNMALIDKKGFVIVRITETLQSASLTGETVKAIFQNSINPISFNLGVKSVVPGNYVLSFAGINLSPLSAKGTILNVSLTFMDCNALTEIYIPAANSCFTLKTMDALTIQIVGGVAIVSSVIILITFFYLLFVKREYFTANNGTRYKSITLAGTLLCNLSFVPLMNRVFGQSCMISAWFYNLGFALILVPVITRVFEFRTLKYITEMEGKKTFRFSHIAFFFSIAMILLIVWTATEPSVFINYVLLSNKQVITDYCSNGTFSSIATVLRILVSLGASILTYLNRGVGDMYPEVKNLIVLCYNWFIFGGILGLIAQEVIQIPDISFAMFAVSVLIPSIVGQILIFTADTSFHKSLKRLDKEVLSSSGQVKNSSGVKKSSQQKLSRAS